MNAVIDNLDGVVLRDAPVHRKVPMGTAFGGPSGVSALMPLRQARQRWASSLCDADLHCLLQILEVDLIPQLLDGYSPARHAPDARIVSG